MKLKSKVCAHFADVEGCRAPQDWMWAQAEYLTGLIHSIFMHFSRDVRISRHHEASETLQAGQFTENLKIRLWKTIFLHRRLDLGSSTGFPLSQLRAMVGYSSLQ